MEGARASVQPPMFHQQPQHPQGQAPSQPQPQPNPPAAQSSTFCCHCGYGIPYGIWFFWCTFCNLHFCNSCHGAHPASHIPRLRYLWSKPTALGEAPLQKGCGKCMKLTHTGVQCCECPLSSCLDCSAFGTDEVWRDHEHKRLCLVHPPTNHSPLHALPTTCRGCMDGSASYGHCDQCGQGNHPTPYS
jgi:hypothetical protein